MRGSKLAVTATLIALVVALSTPATGWARAELTNLGGAVCCLDLDIRVTVGLDGGRLRSALEVAGRELASVSVGPQDAVRLGVPIVMIVTELQRARTDRLVSSPGNSGVR
jgi:hypothetical protein